MCALRGSGLRVRAPLWCRLSDLFHRVHFAGKQILEGLLDPELQRQCAGRAAAASSHHVDSHDAIVNLDELYIAAVAKSGMPIYGECGGYMALGTGLVDAHGTRHAMCGLLPLVTSFAERSLHLGYREAELIGDTSLGMKGAQFRGHEFHYATIVEEDGRDVLFRCRDSAGAAVGAMGRRIGNVAGSFLHLIDRRD